MSARPEEAPRNVIETGTDQGRIRLEAEKADADVAAWIERKKAIRAKMAAPNYSAPETPPISSSKPAPSAPEEKNPDSIEKDDLFSSPSQNYKFIPPEVSKKYLLVGNKYHYSGATKSVAFIDQGDKLKTSSSSPQIAEELVKIAEGRGWEELRVRGTNAFKREVWLEASVRGIHVAGYKPSELDKAELERRSTFIREENSIEVRSNAFTKLPPSEGIRKDPSLTNAYAAVAAAKAFAKEKIGDSGSRQSFVDAVTRTVTNKIETSQAIPTVLLRVPEGTLIDHGAAPYNFDKDQNNSYYVKLSDRAGKERVLWGLGLKKAIADARAIPGDKIRLNAAKAKEVTVAPSIRGVNRGAGQTSFDASRNDWQAEVLSREHSPSRAQGQDRVRSA